MSLFFHLSDRFVSLLRTQAYAAARFAESCMRAMDGDSDVYECAYVQSEVCALLTLSMPSVLKSLIECFIGWRQLERGDEPGHASSDPLLILFEASITRIPDL